MRLPPVPKGATLTKSGLPLDLNERLNALRVTTADVQDMSIETYRDLRPVLLGTASYWWHQLPLWSVAMQIDEIRKQA